ncbi:hypothetical protein D1872_301550 [compost metagenome]
MRRVAVEASIRITRNIARSAEGQLQIISDRTVNLKLRAFTHRPFCRAIGLFAGAVHELTADRFCGIFLLDTENGDVSGQAPVHPVCFQAGFVVFTRHR